METAEINCPYCGETIKIVVDHSVNNQIYIEDCEVCCRPIQLEISVDSDGFVSVNTQREDDI